MKHLVRIHGKNLTAEEAEQIGRITVLFNLVALCFLGLFAFIAFKTNDVRYGTTLLEVMALSICNIALFLLSGRMQLLVLMTCIGYLPFCAFLQITGGQNNSGILWHYVYPIMVYYILIRCWWTALNGSRTILPLFMSNCGINPTCGEGSTPRDHGDWGEGG